MTLLIANVLLLGLQYATTNECKRVKKMVYQPYGPQMCTQLCIEDVDSFTYTEEDLSCQRNVPDTSRIAKYQFTEGCFICLNRSHKKCDSTSCTPEHNRCEMFMKGVWWENKRNKTNSERMLSSCKLLHQACKEGFYSWVRFAVSQKPANINCLGSKERTPIMTAARFGHFEVFTILFNQVCNVTSRRDRLRRTPNVMASLNDITYVDGLLDKKWCNMTALDKDGNNILHLASSSGNVEIVRYILSLGILDIDCKGSALKTPVMFAALYCQTDSLVLLQKEGCNMKTLDKLGNNILHVACVGGSVVVAKYILAQGIANIESKGQLKRTPVMMAACYGKKDLVVFLDKKGCNMRAIDVRGNNILHVACIGGHVDMVRYLLNKHIADIESRGHLRRTLVMMAARYGKKDVLRLLEDNRCNMRVLDREGNNILHLACMNGKVDLVRYLLTREIINRKKTNKSGKTPLKIAKSKRFKAVVALFTGR